MANEFEIVSSEGQGFDKMTTWRCNQCGKEIVSSGKPRSHVCIHQTQSRSSPHPNSHNVAQGPETPFSPSNSVPEILLDPAIVRQQLQRPPLTGYPFSPTITNPNVQPTGTPLFPRPPVFPPQTGVQQPHSAPQIQARVQQPQSAPQMYGPRQHHQPQHFQWEQWQMLQEQRYQEQQEYMRRQQEQMMMFQQKTFELIQADNEIKKAMLEASTKAQSHKFEKKTKCPVWDKQEPLKRYLPRLKLWNKVQSHDGKYLDLHCRWQREGRRKTR